MSVKVEERELAGLRWLMLAGPRGEVFRALGELAAEDIHAVLGSLPEAPALARFARSGRGRDVVDRVIAATRRQCPLAWQDAVDLAKGAGYDEALLVLANLRGDLGGDDAIGCSDLGWRRERGFLAHNEDGAPPLGGHFLLLTLAVDGEPAVCVQWYPGFLPSNTFVLTSRGLAWGINHVQVNRPGLGAGRHFVARCLQRENSLESATDFLRRCPNAGGFTYTIADLNDGRVAAVESAAGHVAVAEATPASRPLIWHTNHLRLLHLDDESGSDSALYEEDVAATHSERGVRSLGQREESEARGRVLDGLIPPVAGPDASWLLDVLAGQDTPRSVFRSADGDDPLMTLCSTVVDIDAREVTLKPRDAAPRTLDVSELLDVGRETTDSASRESPAQRA